MGLAGPDQRDRLGQVTDIVVGEGEQRLVDALPGEVADQRGLGGRKVELAGDGGQAIAAVGVGRRAKIVRHQTQLGIAGRRQDEAIEQGGESAH